MRHVTLAVRRCAGLFRQTRAERRAPTAQARQIARLSVGHALLPASEEDANPFEGQTSHRRPVAFALVALHSIERFGPRAVAQTLVGVFDETLMHKMRPG